MSRAAVQAEHAVAGASSVAQGQVGNWGHPLHPATVHFPIGLLSVSFLLDTLQLVPALAHKLHSLSALPPPGALAPLAHYAGAAGVLFALPSIATGLGELYAMWRGQVQDTRTTGTVLASASKATQKRDVAGEKLRTTLTHASINDIVVGVAAYNWWVRRQSATLALPTFNAVLSTLAMPLFLYSAYLGASLVYEYGVGVQRQGSAKEIKEKSS